MKPDPKQTAIWKGMTLSEKYQLFAANICQARQIKRAGIKLKHPNFTPEETEKELARIWLHARP